MRAIVCNDFIRLRPLLRDMIYCQFSWSLLYVSDSVLKRTRDVNPSQPLKQI